MIPYILACLGIYGFDHLLRAIKTRFASAIIRPLPQLGSTRIEVAGINAGWRAGQHVRVRIASTAMGWWGWTEVHPFTIASVSGGQEGLVLLCKKTGSWTTKLYEMAKAGGYTEAGIGRKINIMIDGPYGEQPIPLCPPAPTDVFSPGGPGHTIFASYSAAVFVVGGSGITFALPAVQDLIQKDLDGQSRVKVIELVWVVQDSGKHPHPQHPLPRLTVCTHSLHHPLSPPLLLHDRIQRIHARAYIRALHPGLPGEQAAAGRLPRPHPQRRPATYREGFGRCNQPRCYPGGRREGFRAHNGAPRGCLRAHLPWG